MRLVEQFELGLAAPICLTWELTYACNLACVHCLSSSGRRDPRELTTAECREVIDTLERMQVFYVNIGGGEPTVRPDFWELVDYATAHHVGVKFSTNGVKIDPGVARRLAASDYVDVQISLDGATAEVNDAVRGTGSYATAIRAMQPPGRGRLPGLQALGGRDPAQREPARRADGAGRRLRRAAAADPAAPVGPRRRHLARAASHRGAAAPAVRLAVGARRAGADRRLVLPPGPVRRAAAGPEPVRGGPGGLPDRPGRRRLRLPVRDPRGLPGRQRPPARRVPGGLARLRAVRGAAPAAVRRGLRFLPVLRLLPRRLHGGQVLHRAAAGRPRPGVRGGPRRRRAAGGGPGRGAAAGTGPLPPRPGARPGRARTGHDPVPPAQPSPPGPGPAAPPARACDENPLAGFAGRSEPAVAFRQG